MTEFIAHRINTLAQLREVPVEYGVELDLRDSGPRLILQHDPFADGEDAEAFFAEYRHGTLILNVKSERIEDRVLELMHRYRITNYFFLDSSFPMIVNLSRRGERRMALRFSEFEGMDTILTMAGKVDWVWVDCFSTLPIDTTLYDLMVAAGYKICLVSPELQGRPEEIEHYRDQVRARNCIPDAVCTKLANISRWQGR